MDNHTPLVAAIKNVTTLDEIRQSAKFHPTIWGDYFLDSVNTEISAAEHVELAKQKEMVRQSLAQTSDDSKFKMELIDAIQRLGLHYHFENEIEKSLQYIHDNYKRFNGKDNDIHTVALRFRLLRQQGYNVSCDVFNNFIDNEGNFVESLKNDIEGLLSFYEAAHLGARGEKILDKAIEFCSSRLRLNTAHNSLSKRVNEALKMPIRKSLTRLGARKFISMYQEEESHNEILLNFAKLDFNMVQKLHQRELSEVTRWWKKFDIANKMPYARDRIVELFLWVMGVYFEPQYTIARKILVKSISMASIIDDTYEYATLNDLQVLTDAIERWDVDTTLDDSPPHIQMCYKSLIDTYVEIEDEMKSALKSYRVQYAKQEMKKLVRAYFEEAKWLYSDYIPTFEEYMKVSLVTGGYMMLSTTSLVGMGDLVGKEDFDWVTNEPLIVRASSVISRVMDDLVGDENFADSLQTQHEQKPSSVYCFMKQYGVSKDEACEELRQEVKNAWKDMNQECLEPKPTSMSVLMRIINLGRVMNLLYADEDCYGNPNKSKEWVKMVFVEPVTL